MPDFAETTPRDEPGRPSPPPVRLREVPCRNHGDRAAETLCARCGDLICGLCSIPITGDDAFTRDYCPLCATRVRADLVTLGSYVPWEDRARLGWVNAAWQTIRAVFTSPQEFFRRLPYEGGYVDPLLFGMLVRGTIVVVYGIVISAFYLLIGVFSRDPTFVMQAAFQLVSIAWNVVWAGALLFILGGLIHLGVVMASGARGFEATFRVYAYGRACDVLDLIPIAGPLISLGYRVYLYYLGLQNAHGITPGAALLCAMLPILLFLFFFVIAIGLVVVLILLIL